MLSEKTEVEVYCSTADKKGQLTGELFLQGQVNVQAAFPMQVEEKHGVSNGDTIEEGKGEPFFPGFQEEKNEGHREIKHYLHLDGP
jgi:hypothetical protein